MTLTRAMRVLGATSLAGALLLTGAPSASADQVRDGQWANQYFKLDQVWAVSKGDGVVVAVIDTGVDASHPDLAGQVLPGYDPTGQGRDRSPTESHGTGMSSEIAARGHGDGAGMVGMAPDAKILPILQNDGNGHDALPGGIHWAVDHGAKIINMSLGVSTASPDLSEAIAYAYAHDVLIVASAGNKAGPVDIPASLPGVLAVGAVDKDMKVWAKSNYGPEVKLSAPGVDIVSAGRCGSGQYCLASGTSDSAAYVSGAAALVRAKFPKLTAGQVANRLVKSALVPSGSAGSNLPDEHFGYGVIRPYEALTQDIPAGSVDGPLAKPDGADNPGANASAPGAAGSGPGGASAIRASSSSSTLPLILGGLAGLVVLVLIVVVVVVVVSRRRSAAPEGNPGQAPYGAVPGFPPSPQPYANQAPPQGYTQQQPPYPNNPYQGGNK